MGDLILISGQSPFQPSTVSGQRPLEPSTGEIVGAAIQEQTQASLGNVEEVLKDADALLRDVVKAAVHLADLADFEVLEKTCRSLWSFGLFPTRNTVPRAIPDIKAAIDVIAVRSGRR